MFRHIPYHSLWVKIRSFSSSCAGTRVFVRFYLRIEYSGIKAIQSSFEHCVTSCSNHRTTNQAEKLLDFATEYMCKCWNIIMSFEKRKKKQKKTLASCASDWMRLWYGSKNACVIRYLHVCVYVYGNVYDSLLRHLHTYDFFISNVIYVTKFPHLCTMSESWIFNGFVSHEMRWRFNWKW